MRSTPAISALLVVLILALRHEASCHSPRLDRPHREEIAVNFVTDEADAALHILAKTKAGQSISEADWQRLFSSEPYLRLKKREAAMQRAFEDAEFRSFMASDSLLQRSEVLATTLVKWKNADLKRAAQRALRYLPREARIHAKIYPMIKPQTNSFVFEIDTDPAIFLYLDPEITTVQLENTLAHEFHHIGYGGTCPSADVKKEISRLPLSHQTVLQWIGAFGEGFAMLAAAGGPDVHPHQFSKLEDRERWDRDVGNFHENLRRVEKFFLDVLGKRLNEEQTRQTAFSFFGVQGPWYTVGWRMAVTIEQTHGRAKLIDCMCDQRKLLSTYNAAAERNRSRNRHLAQWSQELTDALSGG